MRSLILLFVLVSFSCEAQVRITYEGDTLKGNIKRMTEYYVRWGMDTVRAIYTWDSTTRSETAIFCEGLAAKVLGKWTAAYDASGHVIETALYCDSNKPCYRQTTGYDAKGRTIEQLTVGYAFLRHEFNDKISGVIEEWPCCPGVTYQAVKYEYNSLGHLAHVLEENCNVGNTDTTFKSTNYTYGNKGVLQEMTERNYKRDETYETREYKYDARGNKVEECIYKAQRSIVLGDWYNNGKPFTIKTFFRYNDSNELIESKAYFIEGAGPKPPGGDKVGAVKLYNYDNHVMTGCTTYTLIRQDNGVEITDDKRVDRTPIDGYKQERDKNGNVVKTLNVTLLIPGGR